MSKIAIDTPNYIIRMLGAVDYSSITDTQYNDWLNTIKKNISNHLKKRASPAVLKSVRYPLRQDFCDIINGYDFNSLPFTKKASAIAMARVWANKNLPLLQEL
ncbi:MAG: hypothetical protein LBO69_02195 [Ignavibacteria bacterium]|jgi:hypothetical protein|nr:hypothetical protein [Ignavibacteria bacterium]